MLDFLSLAKHDFDESAIELATAANTIGSELTSSFIAKAIKVSSHEDHVLFQKGEPGSFVYLVQSGEVGLFLPVSSTHAVCFRASSGSLVGLPAAFSDETYSMTAIAWKGSELAVMSSERFCNMIGSNPAFALDVLRLLAAETRVARAAITSQMNSNHDGKE